MPDKNSKPVPQTERTKRYYDRMKDAGFERKSVWVPVSREDEFNRTINELVKGWEDARLYPT